MIAASLMGRILLLATFLTAVAFGATVDGRVVNSFTGEGVPGVAVTLMRDDASVYRATTDDQGRFRILDVEAGTYTPIYRPKVRFLLTGDSPVNSEPFTIGADAHDVHLEMKLPPSGRISGRVLDRTGAPIPHAAVDITMESHRMRLGQVISADSEGRYDFEDLPRSASWTVSAVAPASWKPPESVDGQRMGWAPTYYPGVTDPAAAAHIVLPPSGELSADITIAAVPVWHLRGTVLDTSGNPVAKTLLTLMADPFPKTATTLDDGTFDFDALPNGVYRVQAARNGDGPPLKGEQEVRISGNDQYVQVHLFAPFPISGVIAARMPDGSPGPKLPKVVLGGAGQGSPDENGAFTIGGIYPGSYYVSLSSVPKGFYVDSITLGGSEALGEQVQVVSDGAPLEITLKPGGGTVRGTIEHCGNCEVMLIPTDSRVRNRNFTRQVSCAADGRFEIPEVRPGQYYTLALMPDSYLNITTIDPYLQRAAVITVVDRETVRAEVPHLLK
jgi:protocatechuate 3,4-dioxygenase beta subunit